MYCCSKRLKLRKKWPDMVYITPSLNVNGVGLIFCELIAFRAICVDFSLIMRLSTYLQNFLEVLNL